MNTELSETTFDGLNTMKFPQYIQAKDVTVRVVGVIEKDKREFTAYDPLKQLEVPFFNGKGYIDEEGYIWIYKAREVPMNRNLYPYFWVDKDGVKTFSNPNYNTKLLFSYRYLHDLNMDRIKEISDVNKTYYDEEQIRDITNNGNLFRPLDDPKDDFLTKVVKKVAQLKNVTLERLKSKANTQHSVMNMKSALEGKTKMSVYYFNIWAELMGFSYAVMVWDNGTDPFDPLNEPLIYRSWAGEKVLTNEELLEELKAGGGLTTPKEKARTGLINTMVEDGLKNGHKNPVRVIQKKSKETEEQEGEE